MRLSFLKLSGIPIIVVLLFSCSGAPPVPPPDTVTIGTQDWCSKNLDVSHYRNGDPIPQVQDPTQWKNLTTGAWCYYENNTSYGTVYGKLYNWFAVNDSRGLAPEGYHIPSKTEWETLFNYFGGVAYVGDSLKSTSGWTNNGNGSNAGGFNALPSGWRHWMGWFSYVESQTGWYTSTPTVDMPNVNVHCIVMYYNTPTVAIGSTYMGNGLAIRCIAD